MRRNTFSTARGTGLAKMGGQIREVTPARPGVQDREDLDRGDAGPNLRRSGELKYGMKLLSQPVTNCCHRSHASHER